MRPKNLKWRYYKKTVILRTTKDATLYLKEAKENGFDPIKVIQSIVFGDCTRDMLPVVTVHFHGNYWGRLWFHEKVYGRHSAVEFKELPKYYITVGDMKVEVSKESYDAFEAEIKKRNEEERLKKIWRPEFILAPETVNGLRELAIEGYKLPSAEYMVKDMNFLKGTEIAGVKPLTLFYYTEMFVKKFGNGKNAFPKRNSAGQVYESKKFIAYHKKTRTWKTSYSDYAKPFTTIFYGKDKVEECLKWLKDIKVL